MMNKGMIWLVAAIATGRTAPAQELTLDQAIQMALRSNRSLQNAALEATKFDDRRASLKSQYLPSARVFAIGAQPVAPFDFVVGRGALGVDSLSGPVPSADAKLGSVSRPIGLVAVSVVQPLSSIPTIRKGLGLLDIQRKLADEQTRLERQTLVRDVRQLYYGIEALQSSLRAARESVRLFQEVERVTVQYVEKRQVLDVDHLDAQVHLAKAMESVLDLENQRETLKSKLNHKLGREILTEFTVPETPAAADASLPDALQDPREARQRALAQRPEARQAQLKIEEARAGMRLASAGYDPLIAAQFIGIESTPVSALLPRQVGIAGVSLTWEPFSWGRKKHDLAVHRQELQEAVNKEEEAKGLIAIDVAEQYRRLQLAAARLHVASLGRQMAAETVRVTQKQYEAEFSLLKTVLQTQASLEGANAEYQRTLSELWMARAEYERALGEEQ
ncbi:MAG: TolC family protein [Acidobacteriota bacterium]